MSLRILLLGLVGAGKSHLARVCAARTDGIVLPFAKDVYMLAEQVLRRQIDKTRPGDRELLKAIGTAWGRQGTLADPALKGQLDRLWARPAGYADVWVDSFVRHVRELPPDTPIFNDDTRFPNELLRSVRELDFVPFFVSCSHDIRLQRLRDRGEAESQEAVGPHKSEEMNTRLSSIVLDRQLVPVIWNDPFISRPKVPWAVAADDFCQLVTQPENLLESCRRNIRLSEVSHLLGVE